MDFLDARPEYDYATPVIVQVDRSFFERDQRLRMRRGIKSDDSLALVHGYRSRLTAPQIRQLLDSKLVEYVTVDAPVRSFGDTSSFTDPNFVQMDIVRKIVGSDQIDATGEYVGLALFDSGIDAHPDLKKYERTVASVDFTSGQEVSHPVAQDTDDFGHGTHLAGLIGGEGGSNGHGKGIAEKVDFIDVKVIGADGYGLTSNLIQAIAWVIDNKDSYNIRVANLSLGHAPVESYAADPLCQAVLNMVAAGITTVVSAGNLGRVEGEDKIWGGITSPGTEPSVITVAPLNMKGTLTHSDDVATSYGSRGPTIDGLFKPDISAPGNRIAGFAAPGTTLYNEHPELIVEEHYFSLSGSSVAAALVSATAAMMIQENPNLNPHLVKLILNVTAIKMTEPSMLEQGNGMLNTATSVEIAEALDVPSRQLVSEVEPMWDLDDEEVWSGGSFAYGDQIIYSELVENPSSVPYWGNGVFWSDGVFWSHGVFWSDADGLTIPADPWGGDNWDGTPGGLPPGFEAPPAPPNTDPSPESDTVQITKSVFKKGKVRILAISSAAADTVLTVSIEGFAQDQTMTYQSLKERYKYVKSAETSLAGRQATVTSDQGGTATAVIQ